MIMTLLILNHLLKLLIIENLSLKSNHNYNNNNNTSNKNKEKRYCI